MTHSNVGSIEDSKKKGVSLKEENDSQIRKILKKFIMRDTVKGLPEIEINNICLGGGGGETVLDKIEKNQQLLLSCGMPRSKPKLSRRD